MSPISKQDYAFGAGEQVGGYLSLPKKVGEDLVFQMVDVSINKKLTNPQWHSVKGKNGEILGWNYRFHSSDGKVLDVNKKTLFGPMLAWLLPDGPEGKPHPTQVKVFRKAEKKSERDSIYGVEKLES